MSDMELKLRYKVYAVVWLVFILSTTWALHLESGHTLTIIFVYGLSYITMLYYEAWRMTKYVKTKNEDVWNKIQVNPIHNPFKWKRVLREYSKEDKTWDLVLRNIHGLIMVHILNIASFIVIPILLNLVQMLN